VKRLVEEFCIAFIHSLSILHKGIVLYLFKHVTDFCPVHYKHVVLLKSAKFCEVVKDNVVPSVLASNSQLQIPNFYTGRDVFTAC